MPDAILVDWNMPVMDGLFFSSRRRHRRFDCDWSSDVCSSDLFEPLDVLQAIRMILAQMAEGRCEVENQYARVVPYEGNPRALEVMAEVFELRPHFEWRGLGFISQSGLKLSEAYSDLDAEVRFDVPNVRVADPKACQ